MRQALCLNYAVALIAMASMACADDPLGVYLGGSLGAADVRATSGQQIFSGTDVGWTIFLGARPLAFAGLELSYMDFGHAGAPLPPPNFDFDFLSNHSEQQAGAVFGIGYLPLPVPFLDLYAKPGVARLESRLQADVLSDFNPASGNFTQNQWRTDFAYGAGLQARFGSFSLRAEYERINAGAGDPALASLGVLWRF